MAGVPPEQQALIDQYIANHGEEKATLLKKAKVEVQPRIIILTTYRILIFNAQEKKFLEKKGKHFIEIKYLDLTGFDTDGKKLTFHFEENGIPGEQTIRTDRLTELVTHIRIQRRSVLPYAPFNVTAPQELLTPLDEYRPKSLLAPYLDTYRAWCNYYETTPNILFIHWVENIENRKCIDFDLRECPGIEPHGPLSLNLTPVLMALKHDVYFRSLTLVKVSRKEVLPLVAEICKTNHTLTKLVIVDTDAESSSLVELGAALKSNNKISLQIVDLSMHKFSDRGIVSFASAFTSWNCRLTHLKLNNCNLTGKGLEHLFQAFQMNFSVSLGLVYLNLHGNKIDDSAALVLDSWIDRSKDVAHLETLILSGTSISAQYLTKLRYFPKLTTFDYSENALTPQNIRHLCTLFETSSTINHIGLALCNMSSAVLESILPSIAKMPGPVHLNIAGNPIGQTATEFKGVLKLLKEMPQLSGLDLTAIQLKDTVIPELLDALSSVTTLKELILDGIKVKPSVVDCLRSMITHASLTKLSMVGSFSRESVLSMIEHGRQNGHKISFLDISGIYFGDECVPVLADFLRNSPSIETFRCAGIGLSVSGWHALLNSIKLHTNIKSMTMPTHDLWTLRGASDMSPSTAEYVTKRVCAMEYDATQYWYLRQKAAEGSFQFGEHPFPSIISTPVAPAEQVSVPVHLANRLDMSISTVESIAEDPSPSLSRNSSRSTVDGAFDTATRPSITSTPAPQPPSTIPPPPSTMPPPPSTMPPPPSSMPPPPSSMPPHPPPSMPPRPPTTMPPQPPSLPPQAGYESSVDPVPAIPGSPNVEMMRRASTPNVLPSSPKFTQGSPQQPRAPLTRTPSLPPKLPPTPPPKVPPPQPPSGV